MRAVVQRVSSARVSVRSEVVGEIAVGLCVFVGVDRDDTDADVDWLARKVVAARIFEDSDGKMNRSLQDVGGALLAVSQFTLLGDLRKGNRPSFANAMNPKNSREYFDAFCERCRNLQVPVQTGRFRAQMQVALNNVGPVTLLLDSKKAF